MKKIDFVDTVLRDAHQSLMATRMTYKDMEPALDKLDKVGYRALECWGGATFDSCIRYLDEDPWQRIRNIKSHLKNTKTQMLLRGQNLLGYKNYPDDVVEKFVELSVKNGVDIVRIFDALNDMRNVETALKATKKSGAEAQVAICYTTSKVHTIKYFTDLAKKIQDMGADSIAIKDMAGILTPYSSRDLVKSLRKEIDIPIELHTHETTGCGSMTYLKGVEKGANILDTALSPFSGGTSQPPTETLAIILREAGYKVDLNLDILNEIAPYFQEVKNKYLNNGTMRVKMMQVDPKGLIYQVPGGMLSNLNSQLSAAKQEHLFDKVLAEVPNVRKDMGYPPLVTPMSQMVGTQASFNVMTGSRYKMVPNEIKDYLKGNYGKSPVEVDSEFRKSIIKDAEVITDRPANHLDPALDKYKQEIGDLAKSEEDVLTYALFPQVAKDFLKKKYNK
ncbi:MULTISPECIES: oxaloacetate decarboxylase subunit alpha [Peptoniphilus]|jgi:putative carboxylase|uniref:oxaloacetate decarboxylase subunit alpha n=1 Tax=Peptoniphilus TaxID=162289 RepID=UPI0008D9EBFC|nr:MULTISPECIES: oxaloacetate decarboxylase subunit alpha [Peptoniphilus]MBS6610596.1 oxaloacetate decarboxylase subunit alpha [Peptoniphilus harei]MDU1043851.1 oxaloacetate decarboxylase subunit alpha [Peptoniphilus rhinitidis]MDU3751374.1 oxaloacetate decarboxylase subunit alpha [Peptoniphilus rhinitidis]MDU5377152.1 oxaloacetate decarboxylase subunit alpha [Peptoniphilus lacydonensis]MDU5436899.1 oxaloacetate decarboxylase subunit alpha [Peptoniphilus lacydonensis]